jgi:hypothetical protein
MRLLLLILFKTLYLYIVVVVGAVEMWKSHFTVESKGIVFHRGCGNRCGNLSRSVEINAPGKVFHISTAPFSTLPVEMWKTQD